MPPSFIVEGAPIDIYVIGSQGPRGRDAATTVVTGDFTAENDYQYNVTATAIATDPTGVSGKGYTVFVINGSATVGGVTYSTEGSIIRRYYKSGAWYSKLYRDSTAYAAAVHTHTLAAGATDVTITAANLNTLDDGANSSLHFHNSDRDRANHTGTQLAATISDFNAAVAAVAPNAVTSATSSDGTCALSVASLSSVGVVSTSGSTAYIRTTGTDAFISTSGSGAYIRTSGANAGISTTGANASIFTSGANAGISTTGGGNISTSGTFRITAGEFVTTLSGTQTANRSISYPDASGTVALTSDITDSVTSATTSDGTCNLTVATLNGLTVSTSSGILTVITNSTLISSNGSASARGAIAVDGAINTMAGGSFTTGTGNLTGPNTDGTLALTSDITDSVTSATTSDGTAALLIANLTINDSDGAISLTGENAAIEAVGANSYVRSTSLQITSSDNTTTLTGTQTANRAIAFPDASGTVALTTSTVAQATAALGLKTATTTVAISSATAPTSGQVLTATSSTAATWQTPSGSTYTAGTGLTLTGSAFAIDSTVATLSGSQTLTNKSIIATQLTGTISFDRLVNTQTLGDADTTITSGVRDALLNSALTVSRTYTLPLASAYPAGARISFTDVTQTLTDARTATLLCAGGDTINGSTSFVLSMAGSSPILISDGSSKWTLDLRGVARGGTGRTTLTSGAFLVGNGTGRVNFQTIGTGVSTALQINTGSAGAFVTFNGALGNPSSGVLTSCTGLPISTGVSGLGTGVATFLATPTSANLLAAVTDETGSGSLVFATSPTLTTPTIAQINGGTAANDDLTLQGTTNATRTTSYVNLQPNGGFVGIGTTTPLLALHIITSGGSGVFRAQNTQSTGYTGFELYGDAGTQLAAFGTGNASAAFYPGEMYLGTNTAKALRFYTTSSGNVRMTIAAGGEVGIGTTSPSAKSVLDLTSTTQGFLPPRMTTAQRDAITSVPAGLMVYNTTTNKLNVFTTAWEQVTSA